MRDLVGFRDYLVDRFNIAVRRAGMWGGELSLRLFLYDLAFLDGAEAVWAGEQERLVARGCWTSTGIEGAFTMMLATEESHESAASSIYGEISHRLGYLRLDRSLDPNTYRAVRKQARSWTRKADRTLTDVVAEFGEPSLIFGGTNPLWPKTYAYATTSGADPIIFFDLWNKVEIADGHVAGELGPEPMLRDVRVTGSTFPSDFTFTPLGRTMRRSSAYPLEALQKAHVPR